MINNAGSVAINFAEPPKPLSENLRKTVLGQVCDAHGERKSYEGA